MLDKLKDFARALLPRTHKPHRILSGPLVGMTIVTSWRDYPAAIVGYGEKALTEWLLANARAGETWLDIGAHYGYTSLALCRSVGAEGRVFAFEPSLATCGCLARTRMLNAVWSWTVCPFGLDDSSSLRSHELPLWRGMIDSQLSSTKADGNERFFSVALDAVWPSLSSGDYSVHGIKIDVQGMEIAVLDGIANLLAAQRPKLVIEVHAGVSRARIKEQLTSAGYSLCSIPIEVDAPEFDSEQGNASYVFLPKG